MKYDVIVSSIKNSNLTFQQAGQGICPFFRWLDDGYTNCCDGELPLEALIVLYP